MNIAPSVWFPPLFSGIVSGSIVAVINEWSKRKDRKMTQDLKDKDILQLDRSRKSDLFKTIYAEKVKAGQAIMEAATSVYRHTMGQMTFGNPNDDEQKNKIILLANDLLVLSASSNWIMGPKVKELSHELAVAAKLTIVREGSREYFEDFYKDWLSDAPEYGGSGKYEKLLQQLAQAVREELLLDTLDGLFRSSDKQ